MHSGARRVALESELNELLSVCVCVNYLDINVGQNGLSIIMIAKVNQSFRHLTEKSCQSTANCFVVIVVRFTWQAGAKVPCRVSPSPYPFSSCLWVIANANATFPCRRVANTLLTLQPQKTQRHKSHRDAQIQVCVGVCVCACVSL